MMALVSEGAFLDFRNRRGLTAMHVAADYGNRDAVRVSQSTAEFCEDAVAQSLDHKGRLNRPYLNRHLANGHSTLSSN